MLWDKLDTGVKVPRIFVGRWMSMEICFGAKEGVPKYGSPGNARLLIPEISTCNSYREEQFKRQSRETLRPYSAPQSLAPALCILSLDSIVHTISIVIESLDNECTARTAPCEWPLTPLNPKSSGQ